MMHYTSIQQQQQQQPFSLPQQIMTPTIIAPPTPTHNTMIIHTPTNTDVLLGRGVATNRHAGNTNFRSIVAQHIDVYVTSTKKEKMTISKSIVQYVTSQLHPPGRFLEKSSGGGGMWQQVDFKRAQEKTAQALRDGAAPLRRQLADDLSNLMFSSSNNNNSSVQTKEEKVVNNKGTKKRHMRTTTSMDTTALDNLPRSTKKQRIICCNNVVPEETSMQQQQQHIQWPSQQQQEQQLSNQDKQLAHVLSYAYTRQISALHTSSTTNQVSESNDTISESNDTTSDTTSDTTKEDVALYNDLVNAWAPLPIMNTTSTTMISAHTHTHNNADASQLVQDKQRVDDEEFAKEMGPDEHFFELCNNSDPISTSEFENDECGGVDVCGSDDDNLFDSVLDLMFDDISVVTP